MEKIKIFLLLVFIPSFILSRNTIQNNQEQVTKEIQQQEIVEEVMPIKKEPKDLKIVRSDKARIVYKNNGTIGKEKYDIIYKVIDKDVENSRIKTQVDQHLVIEEFNHSELTQEVMKEILFNAYNLAKEKYPKNNTYFQIIMYPDTETAEKKAGKWLALINNIGNEGVTIDFHYDKMSAFAEKNGLKDNSKFFAENGSHKGLTEYIKSKMFDPNSFKHLSTTYSDNGDYLIVSMKFISKHKDGYNNENIAVAQCDLKGNILQIDVKPIKKLE